MAETVVKTINDHRYGHFCNVKMVQEHYNPDGPVRARKAARNLECKNLENKKMRVLK